MIGLEESAKRMRQRIQPRKTRIRPSRISIPRKTRDNKQRNHGLFSILFGLFYDLILSVFLHFGNFIRVNDIIRRGCRPPRIQVGHARYSRMFLAAFFALEFDFCAGKPGWNRRDRLTTFAAGCFVEGEVFYRHVFNLQFELAEESAARQRVNLYMRKPVMVQRSR